MPRHYLKISKRLRPYAAKVAALEDDWRRMIFNDLTRDGRELRIIRVAANDQGPLIGLCGETFFCHAGQDKHNEHSLFISRIAPANLRPGKEAPTRITGEFELITELDRYPDPRESVHTLFAQAGLEAVAPVMAAEPAIELLRTLAVAEPALRRRWSEPATNGQEVDLLPALKQLWSRHGLERFTEPAPRALALLKGQIVPHQLTAADRRDLCTVFGVATLNAVARGQGLVAPDQEPLQQTLELVDALGRLPLDDSVRAEIQAALARTTDVSGGPGQHSAGVARWFMTQSGVAPDHINAQARNVTAAVAAWSAAQNGLGLNDASSARNLALDSTSAALAFVRDLGALETAIHTARQALPAPDQIEQRKKHAESSYGRALRALGDTAVKLIERAPELSAEGLVELAALVAEKDMLLALPPWLWGQEISPAEAASQSSSQPGRGPDLAWCLALVDPARRACVQGASQRLQTIDPTMRGLIKRYPAPPEGTDPGAYFDQALAQLDKLATVSELHTRWLPLALASGLATAEILALVNELNALEKRLGKDAFTELAGDFAEFLAGCGQQAELAAQLSARLHAYDSAIAQIEDFLGSARDATFSQLARLLDREISAGAARSARPAAEPDAPASRPLLPAAPAQPGHAEQPAQPGQSEQGASTKEPAQPASRRSQDSSLLRFDHNWVDDTGRRVPLVFVPHDDHERPYGTIAVPLVVRTPEPRDLSFQLDVDMTTSLHDSWPEGWDGPTPAQLRIARAQWRKRGDEAAYTFLLEVPLRRPRTGKEPVDITVRAVDDTNRLPLSKPKRLRWNAIEVWEGEIPFAWPDTVRPRYVLEHPIGPQERYADIAQRLVSGGSFAVIAPRRFGKTTLVEYLYEHAGDWDLAIAPPVVCTSVMDEHGLDYDALWDRVSTGLQGVVGVGLDRPARATQSSRTGRAGNLLPDESAFTGVREAAHRRGAKAVVVLFDEAQLLFPRKGGHRLGNAFKDRIERCWSRADTPGQAPVVFGFIGLPGLRERAGANFMGILRPYEERHIEERALNRLILQISKGRLSTTREARQRLAAQSGNLYILKTLLDRLVRHINRERRTWAAYQDVQAVEAELREELERGADHNLTQYMRDPLNASEDINVWEPRPCYPVAVALALHSDAKSSEERLRAVLATLDAWSRTGRNDLGPALLFTPARVEEQLATLRELGIWTGERLASSIMRSWLMGVARNFPRTDSDRQALARAALQRIRVPGNLVPVDDSVSSDLYRFHSGDTSYAVRKVPLAGEAQKQRFIARSRELQIIQERQQQGEAGSEYIYKLQAVGLAEGEDLGVEIYQWIDGDSLADKARQLDTVLIADMANKLAMAIRLLHSCEVVHEGIVPGNIILEQESMRPMLIDFGVSRTADDQAQGAEHLWPPEVRAGGPWTTAGDIYALGATLEHVWSPSSARPEEAELLAELIAACKREQPHARIDAEELVRRTDRLNERLKVYQRQETAWYTLQEAARIDLDKRWFRELMEKFRPKFVAIMSGLHTDIFERSRDLALFVDQILEAHPASGAALNLGRVKHKNEDTDTQLVAPSIELLHALRLNAAHYRQGLPRYKLEQTYGIDDDERLRQLILDGVQRIGRFAALPSLSHVAEIVLNAE